MHAFDSVSHCVNLFFPTFSRYWQDCCFPPVLYWYCTYLTSNNTPMEPECNRYDVTQSKEPSVELKKFLDGSKTNVLIHQIHNFLLSDLILKVWISSAWIIIYSVVILYTCIHLLLVVLYVSEVNIWFIDYGRTLCFMY